MQYDCRTSTSLNGTSVDCQLELLPGLESRQGKSEIGKPFWSLYGASESELGREDTLEISVKDRILEVELDIEDMQVSLAMGRYPISSIFG